MALREELVQLEAVLERHNPPEAVAELGARALGRIRRDLLPRLDGLDRSFVIAIIGPNNSGKSSLFSSLTGSSVALSPVSANGGFTKTLVGVAAKDTIDANEAELCRRFRVRRLGARAATETEVQDNPGPSSLLLIDNDAVSADTILIDSPDFDSVFDDNRRAGEALLWTADLMVAVVTPHTYQNLGVVDFLKDAARAGLSYALVYNQGADRATALGHLKRLAADIGRTPEALFFAPQDRRIQEGSVRLDPTRIDVAAEQNLRAWLFDEPHCADARQLSGQASLDALRADLVDFEKAWGKALERPEALRRALNDCVDPLARKVANSLFPVAPFRDALQAQLDNRSFLHRSLRYLPNALGSVARRTWHSIRGGLFEQGPALTSVDQYRQVELKGLIGDDVRQLSLLWQTAARRVHDHHGAVSPDSVDSDFGTAARRSLPVRLADRHAELEVPFEDFQGECALSIANELDRRGEEAGLQWAYTGLKVIPPVTAVAFMALTGAVGDVGAGVAYFVTEPLLDGAVGREFVATVHGSWAQRRTQQLVDLLAAVIAPACYNELNQRLADYDAVCQGLSLIGPTMKNED